MTHFAATRCVMRPWRRVRRPAIFALAENDGEGECCRANRPAAICVRAECRDVYGVFTGGRVRTVEDEIAGRGSRPGHHLRAPLGPCPMPYGRLINSSVFYVEVPKAGSTTVKSAFGVFDQDWSEDDAAAVSGAGAAPRAFAVVREPLDRILSGYGTLISRLLKMAHLDATWPASPLFAALLDKDADAIARFEAFAELLTSRGDGLLTEPHARAPTPHVCVWRHVLSQMWYLAMWRGEIEYVVRLEDLDDELATVGERFGLAADDGRGRRPKRENSARATRSARATACRR